MTEQPVPGADAARALAGEPAVLARLTRSPLRLAPGAPVPRPWGGRRLGGAGGAGAGPFGERFEVAAWPDDPEAAAWPSVALLADGSRAPLGDLLRAGGAALLGGAHLDRFGPALPLLPKTLHVCDLLSVQAHPPGNPELYLVLDAAPGARLRVGFRRDEDPAALRAALEAGASEQVALASLLRPACDPAAVERVLAPALRGSSGADGAGLTAADRLAAAADALGPWLRTPGDAPALARLLAALRERCQGLLARLCAVEATPGAWIWNATAGGGAPGGPGPSAEVHALGDEDGREALILEVRRPGPTYRLWDHARFPPRPLAVDDALRSLSFAGRAPEDLLVRPRPARGAPGVEQVVACAAFEVEALRPEAGRPVEGRAAGRLEVLHCARGAVLVDGGDGPPVRLEAGETALLPAGLGAYRVEAADDARPGPGGRAGEAGGAQAGDERGPLAVRMVVPLAAPRLVVPGPGAAWRVPALASPGAAGQAGAAPAAPAEVPGASARGAGAASGEPGDDPRGVLGSVAALERVVARSEGPARVLAIVNGGDAAAVGAELEAARARLFRADGATRVLVHEETTRRGQLLGLLDAHRRWRDDPGALPRDEVALGIMLPGQGTRMSPLTQAAHGIKPFLPVPVRTAPDGPWLSGATASLWTWTLVVHALARRGFRGVAWKWGDEPLLPSADLSALDLDLTEVDAVRFGAGAPVTDDLAASKEWLLRDPATGALARQLRRRPRAELLARLAAASGAGPGLQPLVHVGSPALSWAFLDAALDAFGDLPGWLDVDGYLFEALTEDDDGWAREQARDPGLRALLAQVPDFRARALALRGALERARGRPLALRVVDLGASPFWADVGQLGRAREAFAALLDPGPRGEVARRLARVDHLAPDARGNRVAGAALPRGARLAGSLVLDATVTDALDLERAVVLGGACARLEAAPGAVALAPTARALRLGGDALAYRSVGDALEVPAGWVHASLPDDPAAPAGPLADWWAAAAEDPAKEPRWSAPCWGNPRAFRDELARVRARALPPAAVDAAVDAAHRAPLRARLAEG